MNCKMKLKNMIDKQLPTETCVSTTCIEDVVPDLPQQYMSLFSHKNSVVIVGNGPIDMPMGKIIDSFDVVVRFNSFHVDEQLTGKRCDVHIVNGSDDALSVVNPDRCTILSECARPLAEYIDRIEELNIYTLKSDFDHNVCTICDSTRGFITLLLLRRVFAFVHIIGFGGQGHHNDPSHVMYHQHNHELEVLSSLLNYENLIILTPYKRFAPTTNSLERCVAMIICLLLGLVAGLLVHRSKGYRNQ